MNNVRSEVNRAIWRLFKQHGITIPVAQQETRLLGPRARRPHPSGGVPGGVADPGARPGCGLTAEGLRAYVSLPISRTVEIPDNELTLSFVRASGPGGQNVNKVASAVQLRFDLAGSVALSAEVKARLRTLSGRRLTADGALLIIARNHRTQEHGASDARLAELVRRALIVPKTRKATAPPRAARERRLEGKARRQRAKRLRGRVSWQD